MRRGSQGAGGGRKKTKRVNADPLMSAGAALSPS